jgi:hypothetical protein
MILKVVSLREGYPLFDGKLSDLLIECKVGSAVQVLSPKEYISSQQIKFWKGILLPELAKNGDTVDCWENRLKLEVMPDEFEPEIIVINGKEYAKIPSITKLGIKNMNLLIEGAVAKCRGWGFEVTLPDVTLRK